jgi:hypothetical protein
MDSLRSPQIVLAEDNPTDAWFIRQALGELEIHTDLLVISGCGEVLAAPLTAPSSLWQKGVFLEETCGKGARVELIR